MYVVLAPILIYSYKRWPHFIFLEIMLLFIMTKFYVFYVAYKFEIPPTYIGE